MSDKKDNQEHVVRLYKAVGNLGIGAWGNITQDMILAMNELSGELERLNWELWESSLRRAKGLDE